MRLFLPLFLALLAAGCAPRENTPPQTAKDAPLPLAEGFRVENYQGKVLLLNFWTTWCPPCRGELPDLVRLHRDFDAGKVAVVGISIDDRGTFEEIQAKLRQALSQYRIEYPVYFDSKMELYQAFGAFPAIPTTFLIDAQGQVRKVYEGARSYAAFAQDIQALLDGKKIEG
ncbi:MAG: TlpA family protein disulfide reductase [Candidatus Handelsmanbacteria bacterium]|nr:TlpA family protein disulfide reductase [Candidatus Handelsmanbacteria bacterium]